MRAICKLAVILAVGVGLQCVFERHVDDLDEALFAARTLIWQLRGLPNDDPDLIDACSRMQRRQHERIGYAMRAERLQKAADQGVVLELEPFDDADDYTALMYARVAQRRPAAAPAAAAPAAARAMAPAAAHPHTMLAANDCGCGDRD